ncbi:Uncharacterized protein FKW44_019154 [Caligus rogercresseyi]|uniref:FLYWCH-type domain-containing protein n=1 Tax=Caligus rogercresseyi TaxID=217165 RepID=A0A7T8GVE9_CALRO|nr:Uncharacterized protein FKW44_019154 [Caligus rogercresseyi]
MRRNFKECKARLHMDPNDQIVREVNQHTHAPDSGKVGAVKVIHSIKCRTNNTVESPQQILSHEMVGVSQEVSVNSPFLRSVRRNIRRHRQQRTSAPVPQSRREINIPEILTKSSIGERFILFDSGYGVQDRMLIFATDHCLNLLESSQNWFCDGTFKVVPTIFFQLFTIHAKVRDFVIPCVYALLPNKTQCFQELFNCNPRLSRKPL